MSDPPAPLPSALPATRPAEDRSPGYSGVLPAVAAPGRVDGAPAMTDVGA